MFYTKEIFCNNSFFLFSVSIRFSFVPEQELSEICTKLWDLDVNRCEPGVDYEIDLQGNQCYQATTKQLILLIPIEDISSKIQ